MSSLPANLEARLANLGQRVRTLRLIGGVGRLLLVLALFAGVAFLADWLLELPPLVRRVAFSTWCCTAFALALHEVFLPFFRRFDAASLAAVVEEKNPHLAERLTSTVELARSGDDRQGSPALVAMLLQETEKRSRKINFLPSFSSRSAKIFAVGAAVALTLLAAPAVAWPEDYSELVGRFFLSYGNASPYSFEVSPGELVVAKGRTIKITAVVHSRSSKTPLPSAASIVLTDADGVESRRRMQADRSDAFSFEQVVAADARYRIEATAPGGVDAVSDTYKITSVIPVELAPDSPSVTVTPPEYAKATWEEQTRSGLVDLTALRGSAVRFVCRFTQPAVAADLEFTSTELKPGKEGTKSVDVKNTYSLILSDDHLTGELTLPATTTGNYRLILAAEFNLLTECEGGTLTVKKDQPPAVNQFSGRDELKAVKPTEELQMTASLGDDVGVARADLEYRVNKGPVLHEPFVLVGADPRDVNAALALNLRGRVKEGDDIRYRLSVQDNLPKDLNGPHIVYYPPDRWLTFKVVGASAPLREQEIAAQRDAMNQKLDRIRESLLQEMRSLYKVKIEARAEDSLTLDHAAALKDVTTANQSIEKDLRDLARDAEANSAMQILADKAKGVADKEMRASEDSLDQATREKTPVDRDEKLGAADKNLSTALEKLEDLKKANEQLARERLDQLKLERLAEKQQELADKAADLARENPDDKGKAEDLKRAQADVAEQLKRLTEDSPQIQSALEQVRADQAKELADKARELAQSERELAAAQAKADQERKEKAFADVARKQKELAEKAEKLADETRLPTKAVQAPALNPEQPKKAAEDLKTGDAEKAIRRQDDAQNELDRLARDLEKGLELAKDPREAAKQLARLQDELRQRAMEELHHPDAEKLKGLQREQEAIRKAAEQLSVPPQNNGAREERKAAVDKAAKAKELLEQKKPEALAQMEQSRQSLEKLADKMPDVNQRREEAKREVNRLKDQQNEVSRLIDYAVSPSDPKDLNAINDKARRMTEATRKQAEIADALEKLDVPNLEARKNKAGEAADQALKDLMDGRKEDAKASQGDARREMERLERALAGDKPADERARDLAKRQRDLAAQLDPKADPKKIEQIQAKQRDVARESSDLYAPEAPARKKEAVTAARKAEKEMNERPRSDEARKEMEAAAKKLDELAKQMNGHESNAARAKRLADRQAELAAQAENEARNNPDAQPKEESREAQKEVNEEAGQVRGGDKARSEKAKAAAAVAKANEGGPAKEQAKKQRAAADALRELSEKLANEEKAVAEAADPNPRETANKLAREQRELAKEIRQAEEEAGKKDGEAGKQAREKALERISGKQQELNARASKLPLSDSQKKVEQARGAMNEAKQALDRKDAGAAKQRQEEAADSLERLAKDLPEKAADKKVAAADPEATPNRGLPAKAQADQARELAKQQRELRDESRRVSEGLKATENPKADAAVAAAKRQSELAQEAASLAKQVSEEQGAKSTPGQTGEQAASASKEAAKKAAVGDFNGAQKAGEQTAEALRDLASKLAATPKRAEDPKAPDNLRGARDLAKKQEELNRQLAEAAKDAAAERAQQKVQQENLKQKAGDLARDLDHVAQQLNKTPQAEQSAREAGQSTQQAQQSMSQAQGNQGEQTAKSQEEAAKSLDKAAQQAERAAQQRAAAASQPGEGAKPGREAGQSMQKAQSEMAQAGEQMQQGKPQQAGQSMQQAAQTLDQAAQQLAQQSQGKPGTKGGQSTQGAQTGGKPDLAKLSPGSKENVGKAWGELSGELRIPNVQDMKAKYGDEYSRMIKLYFEHLADTKSDPKKK